MLAVIIAGAVLLDQEFFRVRAVIVNGCETRPAEEVTVLSDIEYGQSIFKVDLDAVKRNVSSSPYYRVDGVERIYPDRIKVVVHERKPRVVALFMGAYLIMDEEGFILEIRQDKGYAQCPMVSGLKVTTYNVGQKISSSDALQLSAMERVLLALQRQDATVYVSQIILDNVLDIRVTTVDGYRVMIGDTDNLDAKLNWMKELLTRLRGEGLYGGTLYLSENNASYLPADAAQPNREGDEPAWPDAGASPDAGLPENTPDTGAPDTDTPGTGEAQGAAEALP